MDMNQAFVAAGADSMLQLNDDFRDELNDFRKENTLTDVELEVSGKLFPAHRVILSLSSPVLKAAFSANWAQSRIYPLSDEHVDVEIMEELLNFLYTGNIHFTPDNVHSICMAADFLQIRKLLDPCVAFLSELVSIDNVLTFFVFSIRRDLQILREACLKVISTNYNNKPLLESSELLEFPSTDFKDLIAGLKDHPETIFPKDSLGLRETTFKLIIRWTKKGGKKALSDRLNELPFLLENIPLTELPYKYFTDTVCKHPFVKGSFPCIQTFLASLNFTTMEVILNSNPMTPNQKFVIFDEHSSVLSYYDVEDQTWKKLPPMLQKRTNFAFTIMDGPNNRQEIIVSGGRVGSKATGSVEMFDWETQAWRKLPNMLKGMERHAMAYHNGHLYVSGGISKEFASGVSHLVQQYSFETKRWKNVQRMIHGHCDHRLISYQDHLYVIAASWNNTVEQYDPEQNKWTEKAVLPRPRGGSKRSLGATLHNNRIYVPGVQMLKVYNPERNRWKFCKEPTITGATNLVSLNGKLLALNTPLFPGIGDEVSVRVIDH